MTICKNKLSSFPTFSGCANNNVTIPILYYYGGKYYNYNLNFNDLVCGIPFSAETSIQHIFLSGNTLIVDEHNGNSFYTDLSSLLFTGNTSATCINDLYVHNLGGCSPINVLTDLESSGYITAVSYYGDGTNLSGLIYFTGVTLSGQSLIFTSNNGSEQLIEIDNVSESVIESPVFNEYITSATTEAVTYNNEQPTYVTVGGIESGTIFNSVTMQEMWDDLLYPNLISSFTAFNITGYDTSVDVGYTINSGNTTFTWSIGNPSFIVPNTIEIKDITNSITLATGLSNTGTETLSISYNVQKTTATTNVWRIYATRNIGVIINKSYTVRWSWRRYWGNSVETLLDAVGITGLTNALSTSSSGTFTYPTLYSYKYFAVPTSFTNITYIRDASTNLNVALAGPDDGYNLIINDLPCRLVNITNIYGYSTNYYVYRTKYQMGSALTFQIN